MTSGFDANEPMRSTTTPEQNRETLGVAVAREVASGWRTTTVTETQAVLEKGKNTSHGLHIFLSVITLGLWLFVWPVLWWMNRRQTLVLTIDKFGNLSRQVN